MVDLKLLANLARTYIMMSQGADNKESRMYYVKQARETMDLLTKHISEDKAEEIENDRSFNVR